MGEQKDRMLRGELYRDGDPELGSRAATSLLNFDATMILTEVLALFSVGRYRRCGA